MELQDYVTRTYPEDCYRSVPSRRRHSGNASRAHVVSVRVLVFQALQAAGASACAPVDKRQRHRGAVLRRAHWQRADRQHHPLHPQDGNHRLQQPDGRRSLTLRLLPQSDNRAVKPGRGHHVTEPSCGSDTASRRTSVATVSDSSSGAARGTDKLQACSGINVQNLRRRLCFLWFYLLFNASLVAAIPFCFGRS